MGGAPHIEATAGRRLTSKNVIVMYTQETAAYDPFTPSAIHLRTEGTGIATIYRDGQVMNGTWSKPSVEGSLQWLDSAGKQIALDRGNTWVEVVPIGISVTTS